jgi:CRP-like cAMP-binding protein
MSVSILQNVCRRIDLEEKDKEFFLSLLQPQILEKKQFLLKAGEVCTHSFFVEKGCLRGFTLDKNGFEHVLQFAPEDWWIADMFSLLTGEKGELNIEAIEDSSILMLSKANQEKLYAEVPRFERFFRLLLEKSLVAFRQRIVENLSTTAQERYGLFCSRYPTLIHRLSQKQVAAYIGVTPEFLSKIKSDFLKKKA